MESLKIRFNVDFKFFKDHYMAFIFAVISGLVMLGPQIFFINSLGSSYKGIYMLASDAESHYVARMQEFYDGNSNGNAYYFENKNDVPTILYTFSESLLAFPGWITGISLANLNLIYKFILPSIIFILVYFFIYRLTKHKLWSLAGASLIVMGNLLLSLPDLLTLLKFKTAYSQFSLFSRPVNPELSAIVFFTYLHLLLSAIQTEKNKWYRFLTLLFGTSFYLYFYSWTFILSLNFSLIVVFFYKNFRSISWNIFLTTIIGIIFGTRVILELALLKTHPFKSGIEGLYDVSTHSPVVSIVGLLVTFIFIWYVWKEETLEKQDYFLGSLLLATFVSVNQQVVTGISMQTGHYHWYSNIPIFIIILVYISNKKLEIILPKNILKAIPILVILVSIYSALFVQYSSYINNKKEFVEYQSFSEVFVWLKANTPKDSVVLANEQMSEFIPVYTSNNVLENIYGGLYLLSPERRAYTRDIALRDIQNNKRSQFKVDYLILDTVRDIAWKVNSSKLLKPEASIGNFRIYSIISP